MARRPCSTLRSRYGPGSTPLTDVETYLDLRWLEQVRAATERDGMNRLPGLSYSHTKNHRSRVSGY